MENWILKDCISYLETQILNLEHQLMDSEEQDPRLRAAKAAYEDARLELLKSAQTAADIMNLYLSSKPDNPWMRKPVSSPHPEESSAEYTSQLPEGLASYPRENRGTSRPLTPVG